MSNWLNKQADEIGFNKGKKMYAIAYNGKRLAGYYPNGFAGGMREAFLFSNNSWFNFESLENAKNKILDIKSELKNWINNDIILEQSKDWGDKQDEFIEDNKKNYNIMLDNINNFKIVSI